MKSNKTRELSVVGAGHVGSALAVAFGRVGWFVRTVVDADPKKAMRVASLCGAGAAATELTAVAGSEMIVLCVPDEKIAAVASDLSRIVKIRKGMAVHTSGRLSSDVLDPLKRRGWKTASMHPCCSFALHEKTRLQNVGFALEGNSELIRFLKSAVIELGGIPFAIDSREKTAYHTACVLASNGLVALFGIIEGMGFGSDSPVFQALLTLVNGTLDNLTSGAACALTGPAARGDLETLEAHLEVLKQNPLASGIYSYLSLEMLKLARNLPQEKKSRIQARLDEVRKGAP